MKVSFYFLCAIFLILVGNDLSWWFSPFVSFDRSNYVFPFHGFKIRLNCLLLFCLHQTEEDISPVLAPKPKEAPKEEPIDTSSPSKPSASGPTRGTPTSKSAKTKRKANGDDSKPTNGAPLKKVKTETVRNY